MIARASSTRTLGLLLLALGGAGCPGPCGKTPPRAALPSVATLDLVRGRVSLGAHDTLDPVRGTARVPADGTIRSLADGRSMLRLDSGAFVLVDHDTDLVVHLDRIELRRGRLFVDGRFANPTTVETAEGSVIVDGSSVSLTAKSRRTDVYCAAGEVTYRSPRGSDRFAQGESLKLSPGEPAIEPAAVFDDWTGGLATPANLLGGSPTYIGSMDARAVSARGVAGEPMSLRAHDVSAVVTDDSVRTEVIQTFFNGESETVDGSYGVRVPDGAIVETFEIDRGNGFEPSIVSQLGSAVPVEPLVAPFGNARLVYDGPNVYRARLLGITPGQTIRVRTVTTSWLGRRAGLRTLTIPLAGESDPPLIGELSIRVDASQAGARTVAAGYGATLNGKSVSYRASDTRPRADFVVELSDAAARTSARAYQGTRSFDRGRIEQFARFDLPTDQLGLDVETATDEPLDLLVVLDTSGGTDTEDLELARATVETLLAQITPRDRIAVRLGDVSLHDLAQAPAAPRALDAAARERLLDAIATATTGGATDLGTILREASATLAGHANGAVLYLGDGLPTDGAMSATAIQRELDLVDDPPRLFALGLGDDANLGLLRALVGDAASVVHDRDEAARRVLATLAEAGRPVLRDVTVELGPTVEQVLPRGPRVVPLGASSWVVARRQGPLPTRVRIRARLGTHRLDRTFPIEAREGIAANDVPRRWATARLRELLDADAGREAVVELGLGFDLVTPWTPRIVGLGSRMDLVPWIGVDADPRGIAWAIGGATASFGREELGERRSFHAYDTNDEAMPVALESTWTPHDDVLVGPAPAGDGGLSLASVERVLRTNTRGPQGCFERKLLQRPDLAGQVSVRVTVDGTGRLTASAIASTTLGMVDVESCVLDEVRGLAYPATGGVVVTVEHVYFFSIPQRRIGIPHQCSVASERDLDTRTRLWRERVEVARQNGATVEGMLSVFRDALADCELSDWRSRRTLATMLLAALPDLNARLAFYRSFADDPIVSPYLRRSILRSLRSTSEVALARVSLGLDPGLDWRVFTRALGGTTASKEAQIALIRRWIEVAPEDIDLRVRLLALLEETGKGPEARRVARGLHEDPLADARVRTLVGEFWLRQRDRGEAVRVFSELVERAPLDPWARRHLGDLYLAHGFLDDAQREYATLAVLRPDDSTNLLLLARAAAAAERMDEALRLEQRVSEEADDDVEEGLAAVARAFTTERLARLRAAATDPTMRAMLDDRLRSTGVLRRPPAVVVSLVWDHPDDRLSLEWASPAASPTEPWTPASTVAQDLGIGAFRLLEREEGVYRIRIRRDDARDLRDTHATLVIVENLGTPNERTTTQDITLTRTLLEKVVTLGG